MRRATWAAAAVLTATGALLTFGPSSGGATDCTPRTAWAGVEAPALAGQSLTDWPVTNPVRVTSVTISWAFAPVASAAPPVFREALLLAGTSQGPVTVSSGTLPALPAAEDWGTVGWQTFPAGQKLGGNGTPSGGVFAARILKAAGSPNAADDSVTVPVDVSLPAGGALWVFMGTVPGFDVEAQTVVTYLPGGC